MTPKSVAEKARVKPGTAIAVLHPAPGVIESLGLPRDVRFVDPRQAQLVFVFVQSRGDLESRMRAAVSALAPMSGLWVFFRKGSKAAGLDMNRDDVWSVAERLRLRPVGLVSVDETWAAFRLRPARKGETA